MKGAEGSKCKSKMVLSALGKETGKPYYVQVGNAIMIDPTFFDQKTRKVFQDKNIKQGQYQHFTKD